MATGRQDITRWEEYALALDSRHRCRHANTNGHPGGWPSSQSMMHMEQPLLRGRHHIGSGEATHAPPHGRASRDEEERYSGYFSCFVTSTIILCLPARSPWSGSTGTHSIMPSIARGPEIGQAVRFLPSRTVTRGSQPGEICEAF